MKSEGFLSPLSIKNNMVEFNVILEKDEDGWYVASVPEIQGCHTQGKSLEEAIKTAKETGNVTIKTGKYGTPQIHYKGSNGITVVVETVGRNAGKIITFWVRQ